MEMCLYFPELGYYTSVSDKIGKNGDYFTSPTFSPVFGELIGKQLEEMWNVLEQKPFTIVEYGAGTGALCAAILGYLKNNQKLYNELHYCIIEKSLVMREKQKIHLNEKVSWYDSIKSIPEINGCVLSNELVDNFSVHQVVMKNELMEVFVDYNNGFIELLEPAKKELIDYMTELKVDLTNEFRTEINLEAIKWIKEIAEYLKKGYVLTIDYGYPSFELYNEYRGYGTLMCYNKHKTNNKPYHNIGAQDITSHVNFSALCLWGFKNGLQYSGFTDQSRFLSALGFKDHIKTKEIPGQDYFNFKNETNLTQTLIKEMGSKFKVLIQHKNTPEYKLMGLS
jgi:SAM-dependent MidA family methyltransferase